MTRIFVILSAGFAFAQSANSVSAAEWGDVQLRFLFDGNPPKPTEFQFGAQKVVDESLLVDADNSGIKNIVVYMYLRPEERRPPIHPDLSPGNPAVLSINNFRFDPHVLTVHMPGPLNIKNLDPVGYNVSVNSFRNSSMNLIIPGNGQGALRLAVEERLPTKVTCVIHPWMSGWLVAKEHPYMGVSDEDGQVVIKQIPVGTWTFQLWHERGGYLVDAKHEGKRVHWSRGRVEIDVKPGNNDFGVIKIARDALTSH